MIAEEEEARGAKGVESRGRSPVIGGTLVCSFSIIILDSDSIKTLGRE